MASTMRSSLHGGHVTGDTNIRLTEGGVLPDQRAQHAPETGCDPVLIPRGGRQDAC
jgi:hypothetical protein